MRKQAQFALLSLEQGLQPVASMTEQVIPAREVVVVRLYLASSYERRQLLFRRLQQWEKLKGATMMEASAGFGEHGMAQGDLVPAIIEFFETKEAAEKVIADIGHLADHIVSWPARDYSRTNGQGDSD